MRDKRTGVDTVKNHTLQKNTPRPNTVQTPRCGTAEERKRARELSEAGWGTVPPEQFRIDMEPEFVAMWKNVADYTMTSMERGYSLYNSVGYVCDRDIPGAFVECGVWKGGSCMLAAYTIAERGYEPRHMYLFDTYTGMTAPSDEDIIAWNGRSVRERFERFDSWAVGIDEVRSNLLRTGYPEEYLHFIPGDVAQTLSAEAPNAIALLRLDTDWYESTAHELQVLYPLLTEKGVLIIDDYGHFKGARKAVDDYFSNHPRPLLCRTDYTGRVAVKV